jgi:hypothetical protein
VHSTDAKSGASFEKLIINGRHCFSRWSRPKTTGSCALPATSIGSSRYGELVSTNAYRPSLILNRGTDPREQVRHHRALSAGARGGRGCHGAWWDRQLDPCLLAMAATMCWARPSATPMTWPGGPSMPRKPPPAGSRDRPGPPAASVAKSRADDRILDVRTADLQEEMRNNAFWFHQLRRRRRPPANIAASGASNQTERDCASSVTRPPRMLRAPDWTAIARAGKSRNQTSSNAASVGIARRRAEEERAGTLFGCERRRSRRIHKRDARAARPKQKRNEKHQ